MPDPVAHLQALVRLATISRLPVTDTEWAPYDDFIDPLPELYPATHTTPTREMVKGHSMIYRWAGRTNGRTDDRSHGPLRRGARDARGPAVSAST